MHMTTPPRSILLLGATGFGLIAVCYGFGRFAFGLFLPRIAADLGLSSTLGGIIAGGSFFGFCLAIVVGARCTEHLGARPVAVAAGLVAAVGMLGIALASSAPWLGVSVIFAGLSTGLASPALAAAVTAMAPPASRDTCNTVINAGTSAGVALSGPVAVMMGADWRMAFTGFAAAALLIALATLVVLAGARQAPGTPGPLLPAFTPDLRRLALAALLTGAASTVVWSFGGELAMDNLGWRSEQVGMLWTAMGGAGLAGAAAGYLVARAGLGAIHLAFHLAMAVSIVAVGCDVGIPALVLAGGAGFGAAYLMLTGVYLVWGISALPERPAAGVTVAFLALAVGQALGAPVFGFALEYLPADAVVLSFAVLACVAGAIRRP